MSRRNFKAGKNGPNNWVSRYFRLLLVGGIGLGFAAGLAFSIAWSRRGFQRAIGASAPLQRQDAAAKPWGQLICRPITLERPAESIPPIPAVPYAPRWFFVGLKPAEVVDLLRHCELTQAQFASLAETNRYQPATNGCFLTPETNVVWELSRTSRTRIYSVLGRFSENEFHFNPYRFPLAREMEWLTDSGLSAETAHLVGRLMYERGACVCFSDLEILSRIPSETERRCLLKALSRQPAVLAELQVSPQTDLTNPVRYWSQAKPQKDIEPILESLGRVQTGATINVSYLLPDFARDRLYCYPDRVSNPGAEQDCLWSALNFFNSPPDQRLLDKTVREAVLKQEYVVQNSEPTLGDILLVEDRNDLVIHACVYVAATLVFTKDGADEKSPWVLMDIGDMMSYYYEFDPRKVVVLRKKGRPEPPVAPPMVPEVHQVLALRR